MDQAELERIDLYEPVSCETHDRLLVHYVTREAPHSHYPFPVLCKVSGGPAVVGWVRAYADHIATIELRAGMGLERLLNVRVDWIAKVTFAEVC